MQKKNLEYYDRKCNLRLIMSRKAGAHSIGRGNVNLTVTVPDWMDKTIRQLAAASDMSMNAYMRNILRDACERNLIIEQQTTYKIEPGNLRKVAESKTSKKYGKS